MTYKSATNENGSGEGSTCVRVGGTDLHARLLVLDAELAAVRQALVRQEGVVATLIGCIPMGVHVYRLGGDGRLVLVFSNEMADRIFGIASASLLNQPIEEAFPWLMTTEIPSHCREVAQTGNPWQSDQVSVTCSSAACCVEVHAVQMEPSSVIAMFRDVSSQHSLLQRLRQAEKMEAIGRMTGGVVHDFNNQLTVIRGYSEVVGKLIENDEIKEYMSHIRTAADHSAQLVRQLLSIARRDSAQHVETDVHDLLKQVTGILDLTTPVKLRIRSCMNAVPSITVGDPALLQNAFLNLCLNARDAMPYGGDLTLTTDVVVHDGAGDEVGVPKLATGIYLMVEVRDTGSGMDEETKKRLFEPFFTTKGSAGTGLGLAGVHGTVRAHGGAVTVESSTGRGSAFNIYLPLSRTGLRQAGAQRADVQGGFRVLLIGADRAVRTFLGHVLVDAGYELTFCDNMSDVETVFRANWPGVGAVILSDNAEGTGVLEVFASLCRVDPAVRLLVLASRKYDDLGLSDLIISGSVTHLTKPVYRSELLRFVERPCPATPNAC